jgi:methyltransferase OMS1
MALTILCGISASFLLPSHSTSNNLSDGINAETFDCSLDWEETVMGISSLRKKISRKAFGHVLETAVGTGRNLRYYDIDHLLVTVTKTSTMATEPLSSTPHAIKSFTGVDLSTQALSVAAAKLQCLAMKSSLVGVADYGLSEGNLHREQHFGGHADNNIRLINSDSQTSLPPPPTGSRDGVRLYDTIIQTFGLCSIDDPVRALTVMSQAVKPDSGRILLLEHGRGWSIVNNRLDRNATSHFHRYGCWYNRDIEAIVQEAVGKVPTLEIVDIQRPYILQLGTLLMVELRLRSR